MRCFVVPGVREPLSERRKRGAEVRDAQLPSSRSPTSAAAHLVRPARVSLHQRLDALPELGHHLVQELGDAIGVLLLPPGEVVQLRGDAPRQLVELPVQPLLRSASRVWASCAVRRELLLQPRRLGAEEELADGVKFLRG